MTKRKYAGTWTALITPFKEDGSLDEQALRNLVKQQVAGGVTGVVPIGTTGESPTFSEDDALRVFEIVREEAGDKVMVMAGTGSNCTANAVSHTKMAKEAGADIALVVCPYYNKPTQEGLIQHFSAIAEVGLPICVYNIKGRTGVNMETETLMTLAENDMIVAVKEASGDLDQMRDVLEHRPDDFTVLSGDDGLTLELIRMGGDGVVSVTSNILPAKVSEMVEYALTENYDEAQKINDHLEKMFDDIFIETNPIPVKYLAHKMGMCELVYRLPMVPPSKEGQAVLDSLINDYNLLK